MKAIHKGIALRKKKINMFPSLQALIDTQVTLNMRKEWPAIASGIAL
jgi:hypothetical protein